MSHSAKQRLLLAAVTGMLGAAPSLKAQEPLKQGEVKCYGVNSCGAHAKCAVSNEDLAAARKFLGNKEFKAKFGKSEAHSCGAHAKCGSASKVLNWTPASADACREQGGFTIDGADGSKAARKP
jgi:hypothetical protein